MHFPKETEEWAQDIAAKLLSPQEHTHQGLVTSKLQSDFKKSFYEGLPAKLTRLPAKDKKRLAEEIYHGLRYRYGFQEALDTGNWTPWPHESNSTNCYGQSIANYAVAKASGLEAYLVEFIGLMKKNSSHRAGHSLAVVNISTADKEELWVIDQALRMYGPATITDNTLIVENLAAEQERTHRRDYRIEEYDFIKSIKSHEEEIVMQVNTLRTCPEAVLLPGQRIAIAFIDSWQSEKPMEVPWYLKFIPDQSGSTQGEIVSRLLLERPGIKSRGLEYKITVDNNNQTAGEEIIGYYCKGMVWSDFVSPVPMFELPAEDIDSLIAGLAEIPLEKRAQFETVLMKSSISFSPEDSARLNAARKSWTKLQQSEHRELINAMSSAEAIYQHEKGSREQYLTPKQRDQEITNLKTKHPIFADYAKTAEVIKRTTRASARRFFLRPNQLEDPRVVAFLNLENEQERLQHILQHKPTYLNDAIDRLIFYERKIKGREHKINEITTAAFGADAEKNVFAGYVRIFAEFLGHIAMTQQELYLQKYKEKIIEKLTSNLSS